MSIHDQVRAALDRQDTQAALELLYQQLDNNPGDVRAMHGIAGICAAEGNRQDALTWYRQARDQAPQDPEAALGLGLALCEFGWPDQATEVLESVLQLDAPAELHEMARNSLLRLEREADRARALRSATVSCLRGARSTLAGMELEQLRAIAQEITFLGQNGIDIADQQATHELQQLPGVYTGLEMLCLLYSAMQQIDPDADIGIDLSAEYAEASDSVRV